MKSLRKGFTLVELMVVIVIIGILAALAIPRFLGATNKAKATEFKPVLKQIYTLEQAYFQEKDAWGNTATLIGFDVPDPATSRFQYSVDGTVAELGHAIPGGVNLPAPKDLTGTVLAASAHACVNSSGQQTAHDGTISGISGLTVDATACP